MAEAPLEMVHRAMGGFGKRGKMCARPDGGPFKHRKLDDAGLESAYYPIVGTPVDDGAGR